MSGGFTKTGTHFQCQTGLALWQTGPAMIIECWEYLRGYNKWVPAIATVESTKLSRVGSIQNDASKPQISMGWESVCKIKWFDQNQFERTAVFKAYEESALYQLVEGDTVSLRFNPKNPSDYYLPGLMESRIIRTWRLTLWGTMLLLIGILFLIFVLAH